MASQQPQVVSLYNIVGKDWYINFQVNNPDGTPVDFTGYTAKLQLRYSFSDVAPALSLASSGLGITLNNAGLISCHATAAQTATLVAQIYNMGVEVISPSGVISTIIENPVETKATAVV